MWQLPSPYEISTCIPCHSDMHGPNPHWNQNQSSGSWVWGMYIGAVFYRSAFSLSLPDLSPSGSSNAQPELTTKVSKSSLPTSIGPGCNQCAPPPPPPPSPLSPLPAPPDDSRLIDMVCSWFQKFVYGIICPKITFFNQSLLDWVDFWVSRNIWLCKVHHALGPIT